jgi:hypothetical protein
MSAKITVLSDVINDSGKLALSDEEYICVKITVLSDVINDSGKLALSDEE